MIVSDRIRQDDGTYTDGPPIAHDVAVSRNQAANLVDAAERAGNIRLTFSGRYRVTEYRGEQGTRIQHEVRADEVSVSLRAASRWWSNGADAVRMSTTARPNSPEQYF